MEEADTVAYAIAGLKDEVVIFRYGEDVHEAQAAGW